MYAYAQFLCLKGEIKDHAKAVEYITTRGGKVIRSRPDDDTVSKHVVPISTVTAQLERGVHVISRDKWDCDQMKKSLQEIDVEFDLSPDFVERVIAHLMVSAFESVAFFFYFSTL